jgi:hypothetical protein
MFLQDARQSSLIPLDERFSAVVLMPILTKAKNFREGYQKSARFSVIIESSCSMSPSYPIDANASRGRAGIFFCRRENSAGTIPAMDTQPLHHATSPTSPPSPSLIL